MSIYDVVQVKVHTFDFPNGVHLGLPSIETVQKLYSNSPISIRKLVSEAFGGKITEVQLKSAIFVINRYGKTKGNSVRVVALVGFDTQNMNPQNKPHFTVPLPSEIALMVGVDGYNEIVSKSPAIKNKQDFLLRV